MSISFPVGSSRIALPWWLALMLAPIYIGVGLVYWLTVKPLVWLLGRLARAAG